MKKILFIGVLVLFLFLSGCCGPVTNANTSNDISVEKKETNTKEVETKEVEEDYNIKKSNNLLPSDYIVTTNLTDILLSRDEISTVIKEINDKDSWGNYVSNINDNEGCYSDISKTDCMSSTFKKYSIYLARFNSTEIANEEYNKILKAFSSKSYFHKVENEISVGNEMFTTYRSDGYVFECAIVFYRNNIVVVVETKMNYITDTLNSKNINSRIDNVNELTILVDNKIH